MKNLLLVTICSLLSLLSACAGHASQSNENSVFAPELNPTPKYFMTVQGNIDPLVSSVMHLQIIANYQTNNDECEYTLNKLEGISRPRVKEIIYKVEPDANGNYELKIPLDYYLPGKCQWSIFALQDFIKNNGTYPQAFALFKNTQDLPKSISLSGITNVSCNPITMFCLWNQGGFKNRLPIGHNYTYQYNILLGHS